MCLKKTSLAGGSTSECPCPRYIPQDDPQPGPRVCRDCEHWESLHPPSDAPKANGIADLMARLKPQVDKVRHSGSSLDDEARKESNAGFKKVIEESKGRGGATKYTKKNKSGSSTKKPTDKNHLVGDIVVIPDAVWGDSDASDAADDTKEMGVGPVPSIIKQQQLRDGGLVISDNGKGGYLEFSEAWSEEYIDQDWMKPKIPKVYEYMENTHELEEGESILIPLVADHGRLKVFKKKGPITGRDLATIKSGKGKRAELSTIYFALRFNVPHTIWSNNRWDDPLSDANFEEKPAKGKGKAKAKAQPKPKPLSTRQSTRKAAAKEEGLEVQSDTGEGPSSSKTKSPKRLTPVKIKAEAGTQGQSPSASAGKGKSSKRFEELKLEPELAAIAKTDTLFLEIDSDSDVEFPPSIFGSTVSAPPTASAILSSSGTSSNGCTSIATSVSSLAAAAVPVSSVTANPTPSTSSSGPVASSIPLNAAAASNVVSFGPPSILAPTATRSSRYFGGSLSASMSASSSASSSSSSFASSSSTRPLSLQRAGADYAAETAAMEAFNEFGNYHEVTPKRTFDTAILESSGFKSPERPSYNPWKRQRKSI
ncbi:hypothetical protein MVEN_01625700 [Mycena venus]|uniref:Uncharacterized protein n=1 Tax=Mycena venus TaxID=2733690 RepID=A0A8H6XMV9_9AGAR|nr:hypothetical protein MVEN_01625700 [Mycena venus]